MQIVSRMLCIVFMLVIGTSTVFAQQEVQRGTPVPVECGAIVDSEFRNNAEEQTFTINVNAGDSLDISVVPLGQLNTFIILTGPTNLGIAVSNARMSANDVTVVTLESQPKIASGILGASGSYTIRVVNTAFLHASAYRFSDDEYFSPNGSGGIGLYTLYISCTLRDGTVIEPGDTISENTDSGGQGANPAPVITPFPGNGFPGLAPVDFSNALVFPLSVGQANPGQIPPGLDVVISYTFDAQAGQALDLTFTRTIGNLNLGLVVLNAENQVVFQASLVSANRVNAQLTLPGSGIYTIGVFRIDLLPPAAPEATGFQIEAVLG